MKVGIVIPSRGLVHSRMIESVIDNVEKARGIKCSFYFTHDLPIPECFNQPLWRALDDLCDYIWFVEEDMVIPADTLDTMINQCREVISVDYADKNTGKPFLHKDNRGNVVFTGVGCMLVHRNVFKKLLPPYFKQSLFEFNDDGTLKEIPVNENRKTYGTQDVYFCKSLTDAGYKINILEDAHIGHLRLDKTGEEHTNKGQHTITPVYL